MSGSSTFRYAGRPMTDTAQKTGRSDIAAFGAHGSVRGIISGTASETNGGLGAEIGGDIDLTAGQILTIGGGGPGASGGLGRDQRILRHPDQRRRVQALSREEERMTTKHRGATGVGVTAGAACSMFLAVAVAHAADRGVCRLNAAKASGTYGYATQGIATGANPFAPVGPFAQAGTVTLAAEREDASTLTGTWGVSLYQSDASGVTPNVTFGGVFQVSKTSCSGDFYLTTPVQIAQPAFHVVIVADGDEVRTIALIPNLIVSYSTAKKL